MALIDKDTLVAEIKRRIENCDTFYNIALSNNAELAKVAIEEQKRQYNSLLSFINILEVKEVDIEKKKMEWIEQLCKYFKANYLYVSGHESFISDFRRYAKNLK